MWGIWKEEAQDRTLPLCLRTWCKHTLTYTAPISCHSQGYHRWCEFSMHHCGYFIKVWFLPIHLTDCGQRKAKHAGFLKDPEFVLQAFQLKHLVVSVYFSVGVLSGLLQHELSLSSSYRTCTWYSCIPYIWQWTLQLEFY